MSSCIFFFFFNKGAESKGSGRHETVPRPGCDPQAALRGLSPLGESIPFIEIPSHHASGTGVTGHWCRIHRKDGDQITIRFCESPSPCHFRLVQSVTVCSIHATREARSQPLRKVTKDSDAPRRASVSSDADQETYGPWRHTRTHTHGGALLHTHTHSRTLTRTLPNSRGGPTLPGVGHTDQGHLQQAVTEEGESLPLLKQR